MSDTLSPSEIQSLFGGLDLSRGLQSAAGPVDASAVANGGAGQFTLPLCLVAVEQAGLLAWQGEFSRRWQQDWTDGFRERFSLGESSVSVTRLRDFIATHQNWRSFQLTTMQPDHTIWIALDDQFLKHYLDFVLAVSPADAKDTGVRNWGSVEIQLTGRLVQGAGRALSDASTHDQPTFRVTPLEFSSEWAAAAPIFLLSELVQLEFELHCGLSVGRMHVGVPRALAHSWSKSGGSGSVDHHAARPAPQTDAVDLRATLAAIQITRSELQQLEVGDVILLGGDAEAQCEVTLNGESGFQATFGSHAGSKAIQLKTAMNCP